jgi:hypothetical protein
MINGTIELIFLHIQIENIISACHAQRENFSDRCIRSNWC